MTSVDSVGFFFGKIGAALSFGSLGLDFFLLAKDSELNKIAGNSIAIPTVGAILAVLLAATEPIQAAAVGAVQSPRKRRRLLEMSPPTWIGLGRVSPNAGKFDCLLQSGTEEKGDGQQKMDRWLKKRKV